MVTAHRNRSIGRQLRQRSRRSLRQSRTRHRQVSDDQLKWAVVIGALALLIFGDVLLSSR